MTQEQSELLGKFIAKESDAAHSYNGFVKSISWGYSLKALTKSLFGVDQLTYKELLKRHGATHMGELTGEQTVAYGADDAFWAVHVFHALHKQMDPGVFLAFLKQENPMIYTYADTWREGLRINLPAVYARRDVERKKTAEMLRSLKADVKTLLPFAAEPNQAMVDSQEWYQKGWANKRKQIANWALSRDSGDDFEQCFQISNPIGNSWAQELGVDVPRSGKLNLTHYYGMRTLLFDLMGHKIVRSDGEVTSDKDARSKILKNFEKAGQSTHISIMRGITELSQTETAMKLYLTPYTQLLDPETSRMYPSLSSRLASRRMAASFPNPMQLAKRSDSRYIRGYYLADSEDHVVISADWSSVELVLIGDQSGDPGFAEVFGQLPYGDLHSGAAADCLGWDEDEFMGFKTGLNPMNRELRDFYGAVLTPQKYYGFMRTEVGKTASFNYWYSGSLSTVGEKVGWTSEQMWAAVERYRDRFAVAEEWRIALGNEGVDRGFITLPDGHKRVRLEATPQWRQAMLGKFASISAARPLMDFADLALRRIQTRAKNQLVNSMIQGTCATLAKRTILALQAEIIARGWDQLVDGTPLARLLMPIHDELVFSVHRSIAFEFIGVLRRCMTDHKDIMKTLPLDCTVSVGRTFLPYDDKNPAFSQIELDEAAPIANVIPLDFAGKKLPGDLVHAVIEFVADAKIAA